MNNRREHERSPVNRAEIPGRFLLHVEENIVNFHKVNDVSISGMGLDIDRQLPIGQVVGLSYESADFRIAIHGEIAWCRAHAEQWQIGIKFTEADANDNIMFFMTLREYMDDYDQAV